MHEIRFYYKNDDKNCKEYVSYHLYNSYKTYEEACKELQWLIDLYKEIGVDEVIFNYGFPKNKIEYYTLFLNKKGKDFVTIFSV